MSGNHHNTGSLHESLDTPVHNAAPAVKIAGLVIFLFAVVATPPRALFAFVVHLAIVALVAVLARIPVKVLARRLLIETPFVIFALALPFVGRGPHHEVAGISISVPGLWAAWGILAKATMGTAATVVLAWSTPVSDILVGLERLRAPRALTAIAGFMIRYLDVIASELHRLQVARVSRGDNPRWIWQARAVAQTVGTMFVRSFERGERVHQAMVSRGFDGSFPATTPVPVSGGLQGLSMVLALGALAWITAAVALVR